MHTAPELNERRGNTMDMIDSSRRGFLKSAVAAGAAVMASAAANAGIPASSVKKYDETFDVVIIGSGFAGMACAYKAAQAGLKILMLEKMSVVGGVHGASRLGTVAVIDALTFGMIAGEQFAAMAK